MTKFLAPRRLHRGGRRRLRARRPRCCVGRGAGSPRSPKPRPRAQHRISSAARGTSLAGREGIDHEESDQSPQLRSAGDPRDGAEQATAAAPGITVLTELLDVDPRVALVDLSTTRAWWCSDRAAADRCKTALLGSVSASVARHAHCPVVVCRPPTTEPAVDGSGWSSAPDGGEASRPVLEFAFAQASLRRRPAHRHALLLGRRCSDQRPGRRHRPDEHGGPLRPAAVAGRVRGRSGREVPRRPVTQELARGLVDECLADLDPAAGRCVVVGQDRGHGWSRFLHTSCALAVLERARTTVAVVPETHSGEERDDERTHQRRGRWRRR